MKQSINKEALAIARDSRRMTQSALAEEIGVSQATLSKVEHGLQEATPDLVSLYSRALHYPVSFFYEELPDRRLPVTFYRKLKRTPNPVLRSISAQMRILRMHIAKLLRSVEPRPVKLPIMSLREWRMAPSDLAREMRLQWHIADGPFYDLTRVVEDHGVFIVRWNFGHNDVAGLSFFEREDGLPPVIVIAHDLPNDRYRWTVAHELAHVLFHIHEPLPGPDSEIEADEFAAELLMPQAAIRPFLHRLTIDRLASLKAHWRVSMAALLQRAKTLETIGESQREKLWRLYNHLGYARAEPVEVPPEPPTLLRDLVRFHMDRLDYSVPDLAATLSAQADEIYNAYLAEPGRLRVVRAKF